MASLTNYTSYADATAHFSNEALWALFDGRPERLNIAHECIDRHAADPHRVAVRIAHEDGRDESLTFDAIARYSARFAHFLQDWGVERGDRVAVMLEPSLAFYACIFGCMKCGAVAVPMFTLFGPEGARLRLDDCSRLSPDTSNSETVLSSLQNATRISATVSPWNGGKRVLGGGREQPYTYQVAISCCGAEKETPEGFTANGGFVRLTLDRLKILSAVHDFFWDD